MGRIMGGAVVAVVAISCWGATWEPTGASLTPLSVILGVIALGFLVAGIREYLGH